MKKREFSRDEYIITCTNCHGDEKVPVKIVAEAAGLYMSKESKADCPVCNGKGVVDLLPEVNKQTVIIWIWKGLATIFAIMSLIAMWGIWMPSNPLEVLASGNLKLFADNLALSAFLPFISFGFLAFSAISNRDKKQIYKLMEMAKSKRNDEAYLANHAS